MIEQQYRPTMSDENLIYMHCPSNTPALEGVNTPAKFTVPMPGGERQFFGKWEAALAEAAIPLATDTPISAVYLGKEDPRNTPLIWVETNEKPDTTTVNGLYAQHDNFYCYNLFDESKRQWNVKPDEASFGEPKEQLKYDFVHLYSVLLALNQLLVFNGKKLFNFDLKKKKILTLEQGYTIYLYKDLMKHVYDITSSSAVNGRNLWMKDPSGTVRWYSFINTNYGPYKPEDSIVAFDTDTLDYFINLRKINCTPDRSLNSLTIVYREIFTGNATMFVEVNAGQNNRESRFPMYTFLPEMLALHETGPYTALEILQAINTLLSYPTVETALKNLRGKVIERFDKTSITFAPKMCLVLSKELVKILGIGASDYEEITQAKLADYDFTTGAMNYDRGSNFWRENTYVRVPKTLAFTTDLLGKKSPKKNYISTTISRTTYQENGQDKRYYNWSLYNANPPIDTTHKSTSDISTVYVNTDFVEGHVVGNTISDVLRSIHVTPGQTLINKEFEHLQFYPLRNNNFSQIKFELTDDTGKTLKLNNGVTSLTLALKEVV